jgi:iron complex outermembrane receptor protein
MEQYSSEMQLAGSAFGDVLDYVVGATYLSEKGSDNSQGSTYSGANYTTSNTFRSNIKNEAFGLYLQGKFRVTDQIDLVAGVRHSWDTRKNLSDNVTFRTGGVNLPITAANYCLIPGKVASADGHCYFSAKDSYQAWSYTAGLNFHVNDDIMIFAKSSKGYRAGAQQLRTVGIVGALDTSLASKPEVNFEHEIGIKSQFMDRMVTFNASFYYNNVKDFQSTKILTIPGTSTRYTSVINPADLRNYGVEVDLVIKPTEGVTLYGSLALNDEAYKNCAGGVCPDFIRDIVQKQFNIGASYSGDIGFAKLGLNVSYNWTGKVPLDAFYRKTPDVALALFGSTAPLANPAVAAQLGALAIPDAEWEKIFMRRSVGTLDARVSLGFMDGNLELYAFGRNLTDERYIQHTQYLFSVTTSSVRNDPRTYGVGLKVSF